MAIPALQVLKNRQYAAMWSVGVLSDIGTWMQSVAVAALITQVTSSAKWGAFAAASAFLALGLFQPLGGVLADRRDRRKILLAAASAQALVAVLLAVLFVLDTLTPPVMVGIVAIEGMLAALILPARTALLPDLVGRENVPEAAALGAASWNLGRTVGPAVGGIVLLLGSYLWVFLFNAVTFAAAVVTFFFLRLPPPVSGDGGSVIARLKAGVVGAREDSACSAVIITIAVMALLVSPFIALVPAMAQIVFEGGPSDTAHLVTAQGVGSVLVALTLSTITKALGRNRTIKALLVLLPLSSMAFAASPTKEAAMAALFVLGFAYFGIFISTGVIIQLRAPTHLRARVISLQMTTLAVVYSIAATVQGTLADEFGVRRVLFTGGALFLCAVIIAFVFKADRVRDLDPA